MHRLVEVHQRVHRMRRRRAAAAAVGAAAAMVTLVALAVVPELHSDRSAPQPADRPTPRIAKADRPDPSVWRNKVAGDTLVHGVVGERGKSSITIRFTRLTPTWRGPSSATRTTSPPTLQDR